MRQLCYTRPGHVEWQDGPDPELTDGSSALRTSGSVRTRGDAGRRGWRPYRRLSEARLREALVETNSCVVDM